MAFFRPNAYSDLPRPTRSSVYDSFADADSIADSEFHYRRLAAEHERRAQAALALAQEERRRHAATQRPHTFDEFDFSPRGYPHPPSYHPYEESFADPYYRPVSYDQRRRDEHERQLELWLEQRREKEREEQELKARQEAERRSQDEAVRQLLSALGLAPRTASPPTEQAAIPQRQPSPPRPQPRHATPVARGEELGSSLWNALNGSRTDEEKNKILSDLGLARRATTPSVPAAPRKVPQTTTIPSTRTPSNPAPKVVKVPVSSGPNRPSTAQRTAKPAPTTSPFALIESIQVKFDSLRASFQFPTADTITFAPASTKHCTTASVNQYEHELNNLLASLDSVESSGVESIRGARKALVTAVEAALEDVESKTDEAWKLHQQQLAEEKEKNAAVAEDTPTETTSADHTSPAPDVAATVLETAASESTVDQTVPAALLDAVDTSVSAEEASSKVATPAEDEVAVKLAPQYGTEATAAVLPVLPEPTPDEEQDLRGRPSEKAPTSPSKTSSGRRPPSVEIEEVVDEDN